MAPTDVLNIDSALGKAKNRIYRVGVELEGGWDVLPEGIMLAHDGSVVISPYAHQERGLFGEGPPEPPRAAQPVAQARGRIKTGELPSDPLEVTKVGPWMKKFYPHYVNGTCGLHVHMSFKSALHYQRLMVPTYPATIVAYVAKWAKDEGLRKDHPIWERLMGQNRFCQHIFSAQTQALAKTKDHNQTRPGHRYTVINYCYSQHNTLECRLLPGMEGAALGIRAVQHILDITNAFLAVSVSREEKMRANVEADWDGTIREEKRECV